MVSQISSINGITRQHILSYAKKNFRKPTSRPSHLRIVSKTDFSEYPIVVKQKKCQKKNKLIISKVFLKITVYISTLHSNILSEFSFSQRSKCFKQKSKQGVLTAKDPGCESAQRLTRPSNVGCRSEN